MTDSTSEAYYNNGLLAGLRLHISECVEVAGNVHSNGTLVLAEGGRVTGNVSSVGKLTNNGAVSGTVSSPTPALPLPLLASKDDLRLLADRVLSGNQRFTDAVIDDILAMLQVALALQHLGRHGRVALLQGTRHQLAEVHLVAIELRTVHAHELRLGDTWINCFFAYNNMVWIQDSYFFIINYYNNVVK